MGYHHSARPPDGAASLREVAMAVLEKNLGAWHRGYSRRNPEIPVEMISSFSRSGLFSSRPGIPGWRQRLRRWLGVF